MISSVVRENPGSAWLDYDSYRLLENRSARKKQGSSQWSGINGLAPKKAK